MSIDFWIHPQLFQLSCAQTHKQAPNRKQQDQPGRFYPVNAWSTIRKIRPRRRTWDGKVSHQSRLARPIQMLSECSSGYERRDRHESSFSDVLQPVVSSELSEQWEYPSQTCDGSMQVFDSTHRNLSLSHLNSATKTCSYTCSHTQLHPRSLAAMISQSVSN